MTSARAWSLRIKSGRGKLAAMNSEIDPKLLKDPLFRELMAEGLKMQDRFAAEPVYAKTGKGYLKSTGVEELKKIRTARKQKQS